MAYTGLQFNQDFEQRVDKVYNDYYSPAQLRAFFNRVFQLSITSKYETLTGQKRYDQLRGLIISQKNVPASSGRVLLQQVNITNYFSNGAFNLAYPSNASVGESIRFVLRFSNNTGTDARGTIISLSGGTPQQIITTTVPAIPPGATLVSGYAETAQSVPDYMHLLSFTPGYEFNVSSPVADIEAKPDKVEVLFSYMDSLRDGERVRMSGVVGTTSANGIKYVQQTGYKRYRLFQDEDLTIPTTGNAAYITGGIVTRFTETKGFLNTADLLNYIDEPTRQFPMGRITDNALFLFPPKDLSYVLIDYIRKPPVLIDPENDTTDLTSFYSYEFLQYVIDYAAQLFDLNTRNGQALNIDSMQTVANQ